MKYLKIFEGSESFFGTTNYGDFEINKPANKVIFNMFICDYESPKWKENVEILKRIDFPTSIEKSKGYHKGLSIQVLLDMDIQSAKEFSDEIFNMFLDKPLIVIAEVNVIMKKQPIGYYFDKDLWEPGRYFDKLIERGEGGVFIYE
jgi:hypothetical protein